MYILITYYLNQRYEITCNSLDEALSLAMDAFNKNHELYEIRKDGDILLYHGEIYEKLGKAIY